MLWSIDTRDAEGAPWYAIAATVERLAHSGSIVLMHEKYGQTVEALQRRLLPWLHYHRYRLVSVPGCWRSIP